ncbi:MAG TPA: hypothetical protein ENN22_14225 [bacterium]|nr:hypothetical protein [bacterium]
MINNRPRDFRNTRWNTGPRSAEIKIIEKKYPNTSSNINGMMNSVNGTINIKSSARLQMRVVSVIEFAVLMSF